MKPDGPMKHFILAFLLAVICYVFFYHAIEGRRTRKGPWEITFTNDASGGPALIINQPKLAITNAQISFPSERPQPGFSGSTLKFGQALAVPYELPFGTCIFMDTTFLPGTVTLRLYGHEVELLPRVLVIDRQEHPWLSDSTITLHPASTNQLLQLPAATHE
jgi:hypothetical protein